MSEETEASPLVSDPGRVTKEEPQTNAPTQTPERPGAALIDLERLAELLEHLHILDDLPRQIAALQLYLRDCTAAEAAWTLHLLNGHALDMLNLDEQTLRSLLTDTLPIPSALTTITLDHLQDTAEACALLAHAQLHQQADPRSLVEWIEHLSSHKEPEDLLHEAWRCLEARALILLHRMILDERITPLRLRRKAIIEAIAQIAELPAAAITLRLEQADLPSPQAWLDLLEPDLKDVAWNIPPALKPPTAIEDEPTLPIEAAVHFEGLPLLLFRRRDMTSLWTSGGLRVNDRFPEILEAAQHLPSHCTLLGHVLCWRDGQPLPHDQLRRRLANKNVDARLRREAPVALRCYHLLEPPPEPQPTTIAALFDDLPASTSEALLLADPQRIETAQQLRALETQAAQASARALLVRPLPSTPAKKSSDTSDPQHSWSLLPLRPQVLIAALMYAESPSRKKAPDHFNAYSFGIHDEDGKLTKIARLESMPLPPDQARALHAWITENIRRRFGPSRELPPHQIFALGYRGIQRDKRRKAGLRLLDLHLIAWLGTNPEHPITTLPELHNDH